METKNAPNPNGCLAKAEPDEPMFILLARDPLAPALVEEWAQKRVMTCEATDANVAKVNGALETARAMREWRTKNRPDRPNVLTPDEFMFGASLGELIEKTRGVEMTPEQAEAQRRSFAFGNASLSNPAITRETINRAAESMQTDHTKPPPAPKQDETALALWPLIAAAVERDAADCFGVGTPEDVARSRVLRLIAVDMRARHEFGVTKYGVPLVAHSDRDHLSDAYQEALDGVVYLRAEIEKRGGFGPRSNQGLVALYMKQYEVAFGIRELLALRDGR
jgi:hypothetical protein